MIAAHLEWPAHWRAVEGAGAAALCAAVEQVMATMARDLGLDADGVSVALVPGAAGLSLPRLSLQEQPCRVSDHALARIQAYVMGEPLGGENADGVAAWAASLADDLRQSFVVALAWAALRRQPAALLGDAAADALVHRLAQGRDAGADHAPRASDGVVRVLRSVLALAVPLQALPGRADLLALLLDDGTSEPDAAEAIIAALRPEACRIHLARAHLQRLTTSDPAAANGLTLVRDGLFHELGLPAVGVRFVEDETLAPGHFAIRINALTGLPWVGLGADEQLVNDTPAGLRLRGLAAGRRVAEASNPYNGAAFGVVEPALPRDASDSNGLTVWSPFEYLALCLSTELRDHSGALVDSRGVQHQLERLAESQPVLVRCARARCPAARLAPVLRALIDDEIQVRDLPRLLAGVVDFDPIVADAAGHIIVDARLPLRRPIDPESPPPATALIEALRMALRRSLTRRAAARSGTVLVHLLSPELEAALRRRHDEGQLFDNTAWVDRLLESIANEVDAADARAGAVALLTTLDLRAPLRRITRQAWSRLRVLSYQDLTPDASIQPLSRIELSGED